MYVRTYVCMCAYASLSSDIGLVHVQQYDAKFIYWQKVGGQLNSLISAVCLFQQTGFNCIAICLM